MTLNETSKTVNKLVGKDAQRDALETTQQEKAERLNAKELMKKIDKIIDLQIAKMISQKIRKE